MDMDPSICGALQVVSGGGATGLTGGVMGELCWVDGLVDGILQQVVQTAGMELTQDLAFPCGRGLSDLLGRSWASLISTEHYEEQWAQLRKTVGVTEEKLHSQSGEKLL
ncbi:hypothetical protein EYF80_013662 [Liparis tanakae]|uniref:Uncharacterized protein n=1 Tax=Liparis tanakae TaxID=230148 RepID=A0A4Z2IED9_9TELE|nr:hypothetical protein EYF80_013662 [Liparis tanakae]